MDPLQIVVLWIMVMGIGGWVVVIGWVCFEHLRHGLWKVALVGVLLGVVATVVK